MDNKLYKKVGSRYVEVGEEFHGFPSDGIWLVTNGRRSSECIAQMAEIPSIPSTAVMYRAAMKDQILAKLQQSWLRRDKDGTHSYTSVGLSPNDIARLACDALAEVIEKELAEKKLAATVTLNG